MSGLAMKLPGPRMPFEESNALALDEGGSSVRVDGHGATLPDQSRM
jgi:hypothetical protein